MSVDSGEHTDVDSGVETVIMREKGGLDVSLANRWVVACREHVKHG